MSPYPTFVLFVSFVVNDVDKINRPSHLRRAIGFDFRYSSTSKASPNDTGIVIIIIIGEVVSVEHGRDYSTDLSFQRGRMPLVWLAGRSLGKMRGNDIREKKYEGSDRKSIEKCLCGVHIKLPSFWKCWGKLRVILLHRRTEMINWQELTIDMFVEQLRLVYERTYGDIDKSFGRIVTWSGRLVLENIANSDALYHDIDHTIMVALAGQAIIEGKHLREGGVTPRDWMHFMMAVMCHDIGYVKGVCRNDTKDSFATGIGDELIAISPDGTDVALTPYHVDRSKLFVKERFGTGLLQDMTKLLDADLIAEYIEMTRFPSPDGEKYKDTKGMGGLVRAADFIGQLGDPDYLRKTPALYYEFQELGLNEKYGYRSPNDMRKNYASFYWEKVSPFIQDALTYLRLTEDGKHWIANMHSHVFDAEHGTAEV